MKYCLLLSFTLITTHVLSQCTGNLGENIFTDGDFGSGTQNILLSNPNIAPGYGYTTAPPPNDGNYTITNNTSSWGSFAVNWDNIEDNSDDPNGYMMVVNASFEPGLFYRKEVDGLCEDTEFEFSADVYNLIRGTQGVIIPNVTFLIDGVVQFETGNVPGGGWNTYGFTFTTQPGQTSVTLALQNNAPGGGGNDLALDNITFRACGPRAQILPESIANICEDGDPITIDATIDGDQYDSPALQWQQSFDEGVTWQDLTNENSLSYTHTNLEAGYYYYRYLLANGDENLMNAKCRVNSNIKVIRVEPKLYTIRDTLCEGLEIKVGESTYNESGVYLDSLLSAIGCDSIVTLELTVLPDEGISADFSLTAPTCDYLSDGSIIIDNIENGNSPITVFIDEVPVTNFTNQGLSDGDYNYFIVDNYGCNLDTTLSIIDPPPSTLELGEDLFIDLGESVEIMPVVSEPMQDFSLQPIGEVTCDNNCETISWIPTGSTLVSLSALSVANNCLATDSIFISVEKSRKVYFPNAFSPNGDGINDRFTIAGSIPNVSQINQLTIFDRWGNVVFERKNYLPNQDSNSWDGTLHGTTLSTSVYVYRAEVLFLDGEELDFFGSITIIR